MRVGSLVRFICARLRQGGGVVEEKGWFWSCTLRGFGSSLYGVTGCL